MDIRQAMDFSILQAPVTKASVQGILSSRQLVENVRASAGPATQKAWKKEWLSSDRFFLLDVPLNLISSPTLSSPDDNAILAEIHAVSDSNPIILDLNKKGVGETTQGFVPAVIVVEGHAHHRGCILRGQEKVKAWVGELAAAYLKLNNRGTNVTLSYGKVPVVQRRSEGMTIIQSMDFVGGGVGSSLGSGSGPSPEIVKRSVESFGIVPTFRPAAPTMDKSPVSTGGGKSMSLPSGGGMRRIAGKGGKKKKKMRSGGYFGYKNASKTQQTKFRGGSKSDMQKELASSGYWGYKEASKAQQQKVKGGSKSDMDSMLAARIKVRKIVTDYVKACKNGYKSGMAAVAPPGMESTVRGLKKHFPKGSASPFKLAWYVHNKRKAKKAS